MHSHLLRQEISPCTHTNTTIAERRRTSCQPHTSGTPFYAKLGTQHLAMLWRKCAPVHLCTHTQHTTQLLLYTGTSAKPLRQCVSAAAGRQRFAAGSYTCDQSIVSTLGTRLQRHVTLLS